jgi:hypothetical protein
MELPVKKKAPAKETDRKEIMRKKLADLKSKKFGDIISISKLIGDGESLKLRILPPTDRKDAQWYEETGWHPGLGPEKKMTICYDTTFGKTCHVCKKQEELAGSDDVEEKKISKLMRPRVRIFANVLLLENPKNVRGIRVLAFGPGIFQDLLDYFTDGEYVSPDDTEKGQVVKIARSGTKIDTEYTVKLLPKAAPLSDLVDDEEETLSKRKELNTVYDVASSSEIEEMVDAQDWDSYNPNDYTKKDGAKKSTKKREDD